MAQRAGRILCPQCGANNFDTVTNCWKCGAALAVAPTPVGTPVAPVTVGIGTGAGRTTTMPASPSAYAAPSSSSSSASISPLAEMPPSYRPVGAAYGASGYPDVPTGDPGVAKRAAIALAITLPWIGLPIGWIFMMIEDERRQSVGRVCAVWSMIALVIHTFLIAAALGPAVNFAVSRFADEAVRRQAGSPSTPDIGSPYMRPGAP